MRNSPVLFCALVLALLVVFIPTVGANAANDREVASAFAPIFYQALGDKARSDYLTNFNFDGDWRGDNNWDHAVDERFPLSAYVYYAVAETSTHYFIHYAVFHPRDYKGGELKGAILSELMREGAKRGGRYDPTGLAEESSLAHENDMEGCLLVVEKHGEDARDGRLKYVQTFSHNSFSKYSTEATDGLTLAKLEEKNVLLYIEPKGHGIEALDDEKLGNRQFVIYHFAGRAEKPTKQKDGKVGYELLPLDVIWSKALTQKNNVTFGEFHDFGVVKISIRSNGRVTERRINVGKRGASFLGKVGGINMARPPWGWFARDNREQRGLWFFDPANVIKRDFKLPETFSTAYVQMPAWATAR